MKKRLWLLGIMGGVALLWLVPSAQSGTPTCFGKPATKVGTDASEAIDGTSGDDVIVSLGGADTVHGLGGNDLICSGSGSDSNSVEGNAGNDRISLGTADCGSSQVVKVTIPPCTPAAGEMTSSTTPPTAPLTLSTTASTATAATTSYLAMAVPTTS